MIDTTSTTSWMEAGLTYGALNGTNQGNSIYWAEQNTVGSYAEHKYTSFSLGGAYNIKVSYSGSGRWAAYLNGTSMGTSSANHPATMSHFECGTEISDSDAFVRGAGTSLQKRATDNVTWSYGWGANQQQNDFTASATWTSVGNSLTVSAN
jgi:hypothetical protein